VSRSTSRTPGSRSCTPTTAATPPRTRPATSSGSRVSATRATRSTPSSVARPGLVDAAVVYASVSSSYLDNLRHFTIPGRPEAARALFDRFGTPQEEPGFYRRLSSRTYFDRITEPVLLHHGTNDESCPFPWARTTDRLLTEAGVRHHLQVYPGEMHAFVPQWQDSIERTVRFLRRELGPR
jgi:dipeptidyl aminopeptidase/acylaminoacyl peptidase